MVAATCFEWGRVVTNGGYDLLQMETSGDRSPSGVVVALCQRTDRSFVLFDSRLPENSHKYSAGLV